LVVSAYGAGFAEAAFLDLLRLARDESSVLAFWLGGSRGKGRASVHSDYDCTLVVEEALLGEFRNRFAAPIAGLDLDILTLPAFERLAAWGSDEAWMRYAFAHLEPLVDRTGRIAALMADKAQVPAAEADAFIGRSLDHFTNQVYRALKCRRDGAALAAKLEAAEIVGPLLDALFALNGRRLRPYYKYLEWELKERPLAHSPWDADALPALMVRLFEADVAILAQVFGEAEALFRRRGYGEVFDVWGPALDWMTKASQIRA
jgi:hypothetical protein